MKKEFKLRARGEKKYFKVIVYDRLAELRIDANDFDRRRGQEPINDDALGCHQPYEKKKIFEDGTEKVMDDIGIIRLFTKRMGGSIVAHEVLHAAFWQYRLSASRELANFGKQCGPLEENLCHLFDRLLLDMHQKLYKHKLWL